MLFATVMMPLLVITSNRSVLDSALCSGKDRVKRVGLAVRGCQLHKTRQIQIQTSAFAMPSAKEKEIAVSTSMILGFPLAAAAAAVAAAAVAAAAAAGVAAAGVAVAGVAAAVVAVAVVAAISKLVWTSIQGMWAVMTTTGQVLGSGITHVPSWHHLVGVTKNNTQLSCSNDAHHRARSYVVVPPRQPPRQLQHRPLNRPLNKPSHTLQRRPPHQPPHQPVLTKIPNSARILPSRSAKMCFSR